MITSRSNPRLRAAAALRDRGERTARGLTLVDGGRETLRAIDAAITLEELFVAPELVRGDDARSAVARAAEAGIPSVELSPAAFERLAFGDRSDGIVAVVRIPSTSLDDVDDRLPPDPLVVVLEAVEKPGNLGAVLRSADGAGASALVAADPRTDLWNPNAIRASIGTIFALPLAAAPTADVLGWLRRRGMRIVAARVDGATRHDRVDLTGPLAIALGSESRGLSDGWRGDDVVGIRLPMLGIADSLNVSTAAAILLYESRRQRDAGSRGLPRSDD
ncbi:MAG TPA: TrmH family RNA methyltransferase [Candidatus Limnocylindrales bacterium]|nr:TrmH family RNA methyltransferase [Candidatus Limnocylindrales bacterium]